MDEVDILIVGAGVIGLAIAREVSSGKRSIAVVEKNEAFGQETSSRNSEVVHAGMYYPAGTFKAKMCVEGRNLLYEICDKFRIAYKKTGKVIVATEKEEMPSLEKILLQGRNNGVEGLEMITQKQLKCLEPHIEGLTALYSSQTGIIDSHRLMQYFLDTAKDNGAMVAYNSEVISIKKLNTGYEVTIKNNNEELNLKTSVLINCAGLDSDKIAQMAGVDIDKFKYGLHYCKGQYFRVNARKAKFVNRLAYPVPKPKSGGLGVHATLDLGGGLRLGPDDRYLTERDKDYSVDDSKRPDFYSSAKKFMPFLEEEDLSKDIAGIRPKLQGPEDDFRDFVIQEESEKGLSGFINLIGIESPGLTAAPAIARFVDSLVKNCITN